MIPRIPRVVRPSRGPIETAGEPRRVVKPPPPVPPLDALTLIALWRRLRLAGDPVRAREALAELERLAERPPRRREGEGD
jgi:hypothetical protein